MKEVLVDLPGNAYKIKIQRDGLQMAGRQIKEVLGNRQLLLISNPTVYALYGAILQKSLEEAGFPVITGLMPDGEVYKNMDQVLKLLDLAMDQQLARDSAIVALGGGVVGDLAGFVASIYQRGIDFIQVPTTLLSMVDSSVGGKVGVNHPQGKNMIGAFHQPKKVIIDPECLKTLPHEEYLSGLGEILKYGVIYDASFFEYMEQNLSRIQEKDPETMETLIERSCQIKSRIVTEDEKEAGIRIILNLGHTFGHAIETLGLYERYKHGQGVAIGIIMASYLAEEQGYLKSSERERIETLIKTAGLGGNIADLDDRQILAAMQHDKKVANGKLRVVIPSGIGHYEVLSEVPEWSLRKAIQQGKLSCR